jgi:hypothetical protein
MNPSLLFLIPALAGIAAGGTWLAVANRMSDCHYPKWERWAVWLGAVSVILRGGSDMFRQRTDVPQDELLANLASLCVLYFLIFIAGLTMYRKIRVGNHPEKSIKEERVPVMTP